jgi:hypothetical protein
MKAGVGHAVDCLDCLLEYIGLLETPLTLGQPLEWE